MIYIYEIHTNEKNNRTLPITCLLCLSFTLGLSIGTLGRCVESISHQSLAEKDVDRRCQAVEKLGEALFTVIEEAFIDPTIRRETETRHRWASLIPKLGRNRIRLDDELDGTLHYVVPHLCVKLHEHKSRHMALS